MHIVAGFALAYTFLLAAIVWANYRWHKYLDQSAIAGLDYETPITHAEMQASQDSTTSTGALDHDHEERNL
jgi:predicted negative regulator of RcsB-dependent stress response